MLRAAYLLLLATALGTGLSAGDDDLVFRSDVSLVRVDAQVVDSTNRAITHLHAGDFVLREDGKVVPIRNFASENMPVDVLFLLDVSASMRPHVQRIADASGQALTELGKDDRMGIMVFDRSTRVRLGFNSSRQDVQHEFDRLLRDERFNGGTDITRAMLDAADYIRREGRRDARRAIVILTDDQTEFDRDDEGVGRALARADAVMCALIAPDAMQNRGNRGGGQRPGGWGNGGGGLGGGLGGVIFGPRIGGGRSGRRGNGRGAHQIGWHGGDCARFRRRQHVRQRLRGAVGNARSFAPALHVVFQSSGRRAAWPGQQYPGGSHARRPPAFCRCRGTLPPDQYVEFGQPRRRTYEGNSRA